MFQLSFQPMLNIRLISFAVYQFSFSFSGGKYLELF